MAETQARHLQGILRMPSQCTLACILLKLLERCGPPCAYIGISNRSYLGGLCSGKIDLFFLSRFSCAAFQILFHVRNSVRRPVQGRISVALPLPDFISAERRSHTAKSAAFCGRTLLCILLFTRLFLSYRFQRRRL